MHTLLNTVMCGYELHKASSLQMIGLHFLIYFSRIQGYSAIYLKNLKLNFSSLKQKPFLQESLQFRPYTLRTITRFYVES